MISKAMTGNAVVQKTTRPPSSKASMNRQRLWEWERDSDGSGEEEDEPAPAAPMSLKVPGPFSPRLLDFFALASCRGEGPRARLAPG